MLQTCTNCPFAICRVYAMLQTSSNWATPKRNAKTRQFANYRLHDMLAFYIFYMIFYMIYMIDDHKKKIYDCSELNATK
jgi:hypothetical protein